MEFKAATDRATGACITLADVASATGVSDNKIRRARMDPDSGGHRSPPDGWEAALATLARARAAELTRLAGELEATGEVTPVARYRRLRISWEDLRDVRESCQRLLELDEFEEPAHAIRKSADFKAHLTQLVVAYARPFSRHQSRELAERRLTGVLDAFDEAEMNLHKRVLQLRSTEFAHADARVADFEISVSDARAVRVWNRARAMRFHSLSREDVERLSRMLEKLTEAVRAASRELEAELPEGEHG